MAGSSTADRYVFAECGHVLTRAWPALNRPARRTRGMSTEKTSGIGRRQAAALATALLLSVATAGAAVTGMAHTAQPTNPASSLVATPASAHAQPVREADD